MIIGLIIILLCTLILPLTVSKIENNLEIFLFIMGISASLITGVLTKDLIFHIFENKFMYVITFMVLICGLLFTAFRSKLDQFLENLLRKVPITVFIFTITVFLGLISSVITAIIASLLLVEIINILPLERKIETRITILACFAIGVGACLTPVGEPLSTIVISKLGANFWYISDLLGKYVLILTILLGATAAFLVRGQKLDFRNIEPTSTETKTEIIIRSLKIFAFIIALELLSAGFKPLIDAYVLNLDGRLLYWGNTISAVLDNATLASAEISPLMSTLQIKCILMGLLISGGMLIPGNIPNIICAGKLKITSKEWIHYGVPVGIILLLGYFIVLFI